MWSPQTKSQVAPLKVVLLSEHTETFKALERKLDAMSSKIDVLTGLMLAMSRTVPPLVTEAGVPPVEDAAEKLEEELPFIETAPEQKTRNSVGRFAIQDKLLNRLRSKKTGDFVFIPAGIVTSKKALVSRAWRLFEGGGLVTVVEMPDGYKVIKRAPLPRGPMP
jgi:hypothetical protein